MNQHQARPTRQAFLRSSAWLTDLGIVRVLSYLAIFTVYFTAWRPIDIPVGSLQLSSILSIVALFICLLIGLQRGSYAWQFPPPLLIMMLTILVSITMVVLLPPPQVDMGLIARSARSNPIVRAFTGVLSLGIGLSAFFVCTFSHHNVHTLRFLLWAWIAGAVFTSLVAIYLLLNSRIPALPDFPSFWLGEGGTGIHNRPIDIVGGGARSPVVPRLAAFAQEPRHLAYLLAPVVSALVVFWLSPVYRRRRLWIGGMLLLCSGTVLLTAGRTTLVVLPMSIVFALWGERRWFLASPNRIALVFLGGVSLLAAGWGLLTYQTGVSPFRFLQIQWESVFAADIERSGVLSVTTNWRIAMDMFLSMPLLGRGWQTSAFFASVSYAATSPTPNNLYLLMLSETGVIGFAAMLWLFITALRWTRTLRYLADPEQEFVAVYGRVLHASLLATYFCFLFWDPIYYTFLWFLLGTTYAYYRSYGSAG